MAKERSPFTTNLPLTRPSPFAKQNGPRLSSCAAMEYDRIARLYLPFKAHLIQTGVERGVFPLTASTSSTQQVCAIISHWMTPGTTGLPGKWPCKNHSSPLAPYICPPPDCPQSWSASSNRSMGSRCGRISFNSSLVIRSFSSCPQKILKSTWPYSTSCPFSTQTSTISPSVSAVISLSSFIASITHSTSPFLTLLPTRT